MNLPTKLINLYMAGYDENEVHQNSKQEHDNIRHLVALNAQLNIEPNISPKSPIRNLTVYITY